MIGAVIIGGAAAAWSAVEDAPPVVINELMWMGSSLSSADEWIELRNLTDQAVDLSDWRLTKKSNGSEVEMLVIPTGNTIAANGFFLISNYAATNAGSALAATPDLVDTDVALANTALQIKLYEAGGVVIDIADDGVGNPLAGQYDSAAAVYGSMERNPAPGDGTSAENWHTATTAAGFKTSQPEIGTPGAVNSNAKPVAVAGPDIEGLAGTVVNFDGSDSYDPDNGVLTYAWDFGDGASATGATPSHKYAAAGGYEAVLTVSDGVDAATDNVGVTIVPPPAATNNNTNTSIINTNANVNSGSQAIATSCRGLSINELFPNPAGPDDGEFVELENAAEKEISLVGCKIWVNDNRVFTFSDGAVPAKKLLAVEKSSTKLSLTNDGAVVRLVDSDGRELDSVEYGKAKDGLAWAKFADSWVWTDIVTPGEANVPPLEVADSIDTNAPASSSAVTKTGDAILDVVAAEIQELDSGEKVRLSAVITAPVDVLGSRVTFAQDDSGAVSLLLGEDSKKPVVGDEIEVVGTVRSYQGRKRLSVKKEDLQIVGHTQSVTPRPTGCDELTAELADMLVTVAGTITTSSGSKIEIDDGSAAGTVTIKSSTGIIKPKMTSGDELAAVGIVNVTTTGIRILPRTADDLRVERVLGASSSKNTNTQNLPTTPKSQTLWYWVLVAVGGLAAGAKPAWDWWRRRKLAGNS